MIPLLLATLGLTQPRQEEARPVFRVETNLVLVDVFVARDGRAVLGLDVDDFTLLDDGEPRDIELLDLRTTPANVVLALDASSSVEGPALRNLKHAASTFLGELRPPDRAALLTFSHELRLAADLTSDLTVLARAVESIEPGGATSWHDALYASMALVETAKARPLVVLFTDGNDTYSWLDDEQITAVAERSNVVLYGVTRRASPPTPDARTARTRRDRNLFRAARNEYARRVELLRELTEITGGRLLETPTTAELREAFLAILAELRTRYLLAFTPPETAREGWHELEVEVGVEDVELRARRGYTFVR